MRFFDIVLINHCVLKRGIYALMTQELLDLLNRHSLIDCHCCQSSAKFMRMNFMKIKLPSNLAKSDFDTANLKPITWFQKDHRR